VVLKLCSEYLAQHGVAYVSYNALPGWHLWQPAQALARRAIAASPASADLEELARNTGCAAGSAARAALRLVAERRADIYLDLPPFASVPPERPEAPALARAQARTASELTSLRHEQVRLEQRHAAKLLALMDGSRDRPALAAELARIANVDYAQAKTALDEYVQRLLAPGLLVN
jgi:hypothetical protein